jgi:hypothetical protein
MESLIKGYGREKRLGCPGLVHFQGQLRRMCCLYVRAGHSILNMERHEISTMVYQLHTLRKLPSSGI